MQLVYVVYNTENVKIHLQRDFRSSGILHTLKSKKNEDLTDEAAEAWNHTLMA